MVDVLARYLFPASPDLRILVREGNVVLEHVRVVARKRGHLGKARFAVFVIERRCHAVGAVFVHVRRVVEPLAAGIGVVRVKARRFVFPGDAELDGMMPGAIRALAHLDAVTVSVFRIATPVIAVAIAHGVAVFQHHREFLIDEVETVVTVPPSSTTDEFGRIALAWLLVMRSEAVGILAVALPTRGVVIVVGVAVQENVSAAIIGAVVREKSRTRVVVAVNVF